MSNQTDLTDEELIRYNRHLRLDDFGLEKQLKLRQAKILLVGAGGLGCPIGLYLAASGVGEIGIADDDIIEMSNLQRQIAFSVDEIGNRKSKALAKRLTALNPLLHITEHSLRVNKSNVEALIKQYDLIVDGTDNFATRFLLADACFFNKISYLHASVYQYQGQISLFLSDSSPCFRCLFRQAPDASALPACSEAGILGVVTGTIGLMAATEVIKYLANLGESLAGKVLIYNALTQQSKRIVIESDEHCPLCKDHIIAKIENRQLNSLLQGTTIMQPVQEEKIVTPEQAAHWIKDSKDLCLLDVRETHEYEQGHIADAELLPLSILKTLFNLDTQKNSTCTESGQGKTAKQYLALLPTNKEQKILCYCRRGGRSLQATDILRQAGFTNTFSMDGGIESWQNQSASSPT